MVAHLKEMPPPPSLLGIYIPLYCPIMDTHLCVSIIGQYVYGHAPLHVHIHRHVLLNAHTHMPTPTAMQYSSNGAV